MKKLILTAALASAFAFADAQTLTSKNGTPILPEAGDWSIGFDAVPVLRYFGNLFNNTAGNTVNASYQESNTIIGKYMKDENTAYRGKLRIGFGSATDDFSPADSVADPLTTETSYSNITLGAGLQKFRGKGRLRGFYGAEAMIGFGGGTTETHEYANPITGTTITQIRTTEEKSGSSFNFGIRGFIGAEYFFAPKLSVGAEYGWGPAFTSTGAAETTVEYWDATSNSVKTRTTEGGKTSDFTLDVDNMGGAINLSLYF
jgi:hypothetical protein